MKILILTLLVITGCTQSTFAKAYFKTKEQMISSAAVIAIVDIDEVRESETAGQHWTYRQEAVAKVESVLKGELPPEIILHGLENFICARCELIEGSSIVFLNKDGDLWVGSNWHLSIRPISNNNVSWFDSDESRHNMIETNLNQVIQEIRNTLK